MKTKTMKGAVQGAVDKIQEFLSELVRNVKPAAMAVAKDASATAKRVVANSRAAAKARRATTKTKRTTTRKAIAKSRSVRKARR
jgi:hypothetical protein